uniref:ICOS ligand-like n=2 Tax=Erpetoichthys calabaricus TaxID=27687 RepID=A0A8C4SUN7_ERPCA
MNGGDYLKNQDPQFKGRTELFRSELSHGNFSLRLSNVSVTDEGEFVCKYSKNNKGNTIQSEQCLQIAGHYSVPVVHRPAVAIFKDSEVDFTCISAGGFPEPKVHWSVNKKPLQDSSRVNTRMSRDSRGLYNLTSVLTLKVTEDVSVTCTIDNERLREKKTSAEIQNLITTEKEQKQEHGGAWAIGGLVVVMVLLPALIAVIMWN